MSKEKVKYKNGNTKFLSKEHFVSFSDAEPLVEELQSIAANKGFVKLAMLEEQVVGFIAIPKEKEGSENQYQVIKYMQVADAHRRNGIGEKLYEMAKDWADSKENKKFYVEVANTQEALAFWRAMGFVACERLTNLEAGATEGTTTGVDVRAVAEATPDFLPEESASISLECVLNSDENQHYMAMGCAIGMLIGVAYGLLFKETLSPIAISVGFLWGVVIGTLLQRLSGLDGYDRFLGKNFACGRYYNWSVGRFRFCRYAIYNCVNNWGENTWKQSFKRWEDNKKLVGFVHTEEPGDYFMQVDEAHKSLEREMLAYCVEDARKGDANLTAIQVTACASDVSRVELFEEFGAKLLPGENHMRMLKLKLMKKQAKQMCKEMTEFSVHKVTNKDTEDLQQLVDLYQEVWNHCGYMPEVSCVKRMLSDDAEGTNYAWVVYDAEHRILGGTFGFGAASNEYMDFYPIVMKQEYQNSDALRLLLAKAIVDAKGAFFDNAIICGIYLPEMEEIFEEMGFTICATEQFYEIPLG